MDLHTLGDPDMLAANGGFAAPETDCSMPCKGSPTESCGGEFTPYTKNLSACASSLLTIYIQAYKGSTSILGLQPTHFTYGILPPTPVTTNFSSVDW